MLQYLATAALVAGPPLVFIVHAVWCGIEKDGSPFRRDWWTS